MLQNNKVIPIDFTKGRGSSLPDMSAIVHKVSQRQFSGADLLGAFVSNYQQCLQQDGVPIEAVLAFDMARDENYSLFLEGIFTMVVENIFKQYDVIVKEVIPGENKIILASKTGEEYICYIKLVRSEEQNNTSIDIFTMVEIYLKIQEDDLKIAYIHKGEVFRTYD